MYVSLSCPFCKRLFSELYDNVTTGKLSGKAKLAVKPFGINEFNQALVASAYFGKQTELIRAVSKIKERLTMDMVIRAADSIQIPEDSLLSRMENPNTLIHLTKSREEAVRNGVSVTPAIFISSHRYRSYKDSQWVVDAVEMLHRRTYQ